MSAPATMSHASRPSGIAPFVASTALGSTAYIAAFTAAALAAREITGRAELSGLPSALGTIGTAAAIGLLSAIMAGRGRRPGLLLGYAIAVGGAAGSVAAIALTSFPLLLLGSVAVGFGNAAVQLSRYAAADLLSPARRAAAVGTVVWGSTAGAVLGPNLVGPAGSVADTLGRPALEGGMTVTALGFMLALLVTFRWIRRSGPVDGQAVEGDESAGAQGPVNVRAAPVVAGPPRPGGAGSVPLRRSGSGLPWLPW
jgi:MFS family permease